MAIQDYKSRLFAEFSQWTFKGKRWIFLPFFVGYDRLQQKPAFLLANVIDKLKKPAWDKYKPLVFYSQQSYCLKYNVLYGVRAINNVAGICTRSFIMKNKLE